VPKYAVTEFCDAFRLENTPLLLGPVYGPDSTAPLIVPVKANPPPDRFTVFVAES
jgi:hypothetical protein